MTNRLRTGRPRIAVPATGWPSLAVALAVACALPVLAQQPDVNQDIKAADDAARERDYQAALTHLDAAQKKADGEALKGRIDRRQKLYNQYLQAPALIEMARENEGDLVGLVRLKDETEISGLLQVIGLGVPQGARIGNRVPKNGRLTLPGRDDEPMRIPAADIARINVVWQVGGDEAGLQLPSIKELQVVLHTGTEIRARPAWVLPVSTVSVRPQGADEDQTVEAHPAFPPEFDADKLLSEVIILGAPPPPEGPEAEPGPPSE